MSETPLAPISSQPLTKAADAFQLQMTRIRAGDQHAFEQLLTVLAVPVRRMADCHISHALQSFVDAEDLVQRVSLILWNGLRSGKFVVASRQQLLGLARTLLKRQAAQAVKRFKPAMNGMAATMVGDLSATVADQRLIPAADAATKVEVHDQIQQLMERVSAEDRRLLELLLLGHTIAAAARVLKIEPATLRMRLSRLRVRVVKKI